jgi:hypothetical protein
LAAEETAFNNLAITRVYYTCRAEFGSEFGEQQIFADRAGRLRNSSEYVTTSYVVAPTGFGVRGRVLARNTKGRQVLVAPTNGRLSVPSAKRDGVSCGAERRP